MTPFEYLLVLVSIVISLAVADIATSLHRLLRARRRVRWDWLTLAAALLVLLVIVQFWWAFYRIGQVEVWSRYGAFLLLMLSLITMFLLACAVLPDEVTERLDLAAYYEENRRYFWTLFALVAVVAAAVKLVADLGTAAPGVLILEAVTNLVIAALMLSLAFVRSRVYHSVLLPLRLSLRAATASAGFAGVGVGWAEAWVNVEPHDPPWS